LSASGGAVWIGWGRHAFLGSSGFALEAFDFPVKIRLGGIGRGISSNTKPLVMNSRSVFVAQMRNCVAWQMFTRQPTAIMASRL
jgi:hypothetical protein